MSTGGCWCDIQAALDARQGPAKPAGCVGSTEGEGGCLLGATPLSFPERRMLCRSFKCTRSVEGTRLLRDPVRAQGPPGFRLSVQPPDQLTFFADTLQKLNRGKRGEVSPGLLGACQGEDRGLSPALAAPASSRHVGSPQDQCHPRKVPFLAMVEPVREEKVHVCGCAVCGQELCRGFIQAGVWAPAHQSSL